MTIAKTASSTTASPDAIELQSIQSARHVPENPTINQDTALTRKNLLRVIAASISFFFAGNNDGSLGALTPYILRTYSIGTEYVALM
jgi:hypothetical protein